MAEVRLVGRTSKSIMCRARAGRCIPMPSRNPSPVVVAKLFREGWYYWSAAFATAAAAGKLGAESFRIRKSRALPPRPVRVTSSRSHKGRRVPSCTVGSRRNAGTALHPRPRHGPHFPFRRPVIKAKSGFSWI